MNRLKQLAFTVLISVAVTQSNDKDMREMVELALCGYDLQSAYQVICRRCGHLPQRPVHARHTLAATRGNS